MQISMKHFKTKIVFNKNPVENTGHNIFKKPSNYFCDEMTSSSVKYCKYSPSSNVLLIWWFFRQCKVFVVLWWFPNMSIDKQVFVTRCAD